VTASYLDDDGGPVVIAVEEAGEGGLASPPQALWVRVGVVYDDDKARGEPGVWIEWQDQHGRSGLQGPLLLSPATWYQLARAVDKRLQRRNRFGWPRKWKP
jgi:hypothetical protein